MSRDNQVGGDHYKKHKIQPWDIVKEYELNFFEGNALKYLLRDKGERVEDLRKAKHYIDAQIEILGVIEETDVNEDLYHECATHSIFCVCKACIMLNLISKKLHDEKQYLKANSLFGDLS